MNSIPEETTYDTFMALDIRVGVINAAEDFPGARKPAYKLTIDFGPEVGQKRSSAQVTVRYTKDELVGKRVLGVVNMPTRSIGPFKSEVLTLGVPDESGECVLVVPDATVPLGGRLY